MYLVSHSGHNIKEPGSMYLAFDLSFSSLLCSLSSYSEHPLKLHYLHLIEYARVEYASWASTVFTGSVTWTYPVLTGLATRPSAVFTL